MFAGLFGTDVGVKLDEAGLTELRGIEGSGPFGPAERPMGGYVSLPPSFSDEEARDWVDRARAHVAVPPKAKKRDEPGQRYSGFSQSKRFPSFHSERWLP